MSSQSAIPDITVLHVPFYGDRHRTSKAMLDLITSRLVKDNLLDDFGPISLIDIPVSTNVWAHKCVAFIRFADPSCHPEFIKKYNGKLVVENCRLVIDMSTNPPSFFNQRYIKYKIGWYNPQYPPNETKTDKLESDQPGANYNSPAAAQPTLPKQKLSIADRLEGPLKDLTKNSKGSSLREIF